MNTESWLRLLLRALGCCCLPAVIAVVMPLRWIDQTHQAIGFGQFPVDAPITEFLARVTSAMCLFYGGLLFILAKDVRANLIAIRYQAAFIGLLSISGNAFMILRSGLPIFWFVIDIVIGLSLLLPIFVLSMRLQPDLERARTSTSPSNGS